MDHFKGITPQERYNNDVLTELRKIRELLEGNAQTVKHPEQEVQKRQYNRRGDKQ